jgi:hypothetical protein
MKLKKLAAAVAVLMSATTANAAITDGAFSANQIFDVQYYWSGTTLNASSFIAPYDSTFTTVTTTTGQYFKFVDNGGGDYGLALYNSDGTFNRTIHSTGQITALGNGAIFYIGSGWLGNVISTAEGYSYGDSAQFTNMNTSPTTSDLTSYTWASTTPLADGQTASSSGGGGSSGGGSSGPSYSNILTTTQITSVTPTSNNSPAGEGAANAVDGDPNTKYLNFDRANAGFTIKLDTPRVIRGITFTTANDFEARDPSKYSLFGSNDGINWTTIVDAESISLSNSRYTTSSQYDITNNDAYFYYFITFPSIKAIDTYGSISGCQAALGSLACDSVQIGDVNFIYDTTYTSYTVPTDGGTGTIANPGTAGSNSSLAPPGPQAVTNNAGSTSTNPAGTTTLTVNNAGTYTNNGTTGNVTNSGDFTNNGTTGDVTNSGTFTNNASGVTGNVTNSGTFTNAGITGTVTNNLGGTFTNSGTVTTITNLGTFTNSGTGGVWTNGFNGDGNTATITNTGTLSNGTNYSTFNNTGGTVGTVTNVGTFNNTGSTGAVSNTGVFNNNAGGTVSELAYNNHIVTNAGTITTVTYNGGTVTNTGTIGNINNTESHGTFNNIGTVTGTVTTNSTFNNNAGGVVTGLYTNNGTLTNAGTTGDWINNSVINNSGTMANGTNNGTYTNTGTVGTVANIGTMTTSGTAGLITNTGTLNVTGGTASVNNTGGLNVSGGTLDQYTQTSPGVTTMSINQPILITGLASLGGSITMTDVPTSYGRYTVLTAGSVNGTYDPINSTSNYLHYSLTDVKLYITPDAAATQASIDATAKNVSNMTSLQNSVVTGALGNDCTVFGKDGACVSVNVGGSKAGTGDLVTGGLTVGKKINDNWRLSVFTNSFANNPNVGGITMNGQPAVGASVTYSQDRLSVTASAATNQGTMTVARTGPETGEGKSSVDNTAYQIRGSYSISLTETVIIAPYVGVRNTTTKLGGYTETGAVFPLTLNSTNETRTDVLAGVTVAKQFTEKLTGSVSVGVTQRINDKPAEYRGTSEIGGLSTFSGSVTNNGTTNASIGAGVSYAIDKTTRVGVNVGVQQKGDNPNINSIGINITRGF